MKNSRRETEKGGNKQLLQQSNLFEDKYVQKDMNKPFFHG